MKSPTKPWILWFHHSFYVKILFCIYNDNSKLGVRGVIHPFVSPRPWFQWPCLLDYLWMQTIEVQWCIICSNEQTGWKAGNILLLTMVSIIYTKFWHLIKNSQSREKAPMLEWNNFLLSVFKSHCLLTVELNLFRGTSALGTWKKKKVRYLDEVD